MVTLYRHFAADGALLYVGISLSALQRLHQHKKDSDWFPQIARITLAHYPDRSAALAAEKVAIQTEGPRYNYHWWAANQKGSKPKPFDPHPCKGCGAEIRRRRFWCKACARKRDLEYGRLYRQKSREAREPVNPLARL